MASIYDKASLVLIPSGTKTSKVYSQKPVSGDGDFTFSRSTAATRVNADGNIEKETSNLLLQSNSFDTTWAATSVSLTSGQSGYNGTNDAWKLEVTATGTYRRITQSTGGSSVVTNSIYAKAGTTDFIAVSDVGGGGTSNVWFNLASGTIGTIFGSKVIDANIENVGGGWYRCSVAHQGEAPSYALWFVADADNTTAGTIGANVYIQNAQQEYGLVARDYIETTTAAVEGGITDNVPRLDYTDSSCPALLLEPQRTNLITQSEYGAGASLSNMTATSNAATSPEGVSNATTFETGIEGQCQVYQSFTAATGNHTGSVFLKKVDFDWAYMEVGGAAAWFNIGSGTLGNGSAYGSNWTYVDHSIEDYGNGWYRCTLTGNCINAGSYIFRSLQPVSNNGGYFSNLAGGDTHWYGTQVEAGSYATSYIPTYGTSVTRNADGAQITSATDIIGQTEGTLFVDLADSNYQSGQDLWIMSTMVNDSSVAILIYYTPLSVIVYINNGTSAITLSTPFTINQRNKVAIAYKSGDYALALNGVIADTSASTLIPPTDMNKVAFVRWVGNQNQQRQSVSESLIFKTRLSNQEMIDLTTL